MPYTLAARNKFKAQLDRKMGPIERIVFILYVNYNLQHLKVINSFFEMSSAVLRKVKLPTLCVILFFSLTDLEYIDWNCGSVNVTHIYHCLFIIEMCKISQNGGRSCMFV